MTEVDGGPGTDHDPAPVVGLDIPVEPVPMADGTPMPVPRMETEDSSGGTGE